MGDANLLFHGTNRKYLDYQIQEFGKYIGSFGPGWFGEGIEKKGIYLAEDSTHIPLYRAMLKAYQFKSTPVMLIVPFELVKDYLTEVVENSVKIDCGLTSDLYLVMDIPVKNINDPYGYDKDKFVEELGILLNKQTLFELPENFNLKSITYDI